MSMWKQHEKDALEKGFPKLQLVLGYRAILRSRNKEEDELN